MKFQETFSNCGAMRFRAGPQGWDQRGLRPPAGHCWSWLVKAWLPTPNPTHTGIPNVTAWAGFCVQSICSWMLYTSSPNSGLYSGTRVIDCPQNLGQESSNLSSCAGSSHQSQRLPHILGDRRHMWLSCDPSAAGLEPWGTSLPSRYSSA